jgi:GAF domain-containing protein
MTSEQREKDDRFFEALFQVCKAVTSSLDLSRVLQIACESTARTLNAKACSIRLLTPRGDELVLGAAYGLGEDYLRKGPVAVSRSPVDQRALAGEVVEIKDAAKDPGFQYPEAAAREGIRSVIVVPLPGRNRVIGVLRVYTAEPREFTEEERRFLMAAADIAALCIENARLYQELQAENERLRADLRDWHSAWGLETLPEVEEVPRQPRSGRE